MATCSKSSSEVAESDSTTSKTGSSSFGISTFFSGFFSDFLLSFLGLGSFFSNFGLGSFFSPFFSFGETSFSPFLSFGETSFRSLISLTLVCLSYSLFLSEDCICLLNEIEETLTFGGSVYFSITFIFMTGLDDLVFGWTPPLLSGRSSSFSSLVLLSLGVTGTDGPFESILSSLEEVTAGISFLCFERSLLFFYFDVFSLRFTGIIFLNSNL